MDRRMCAKIAVYVADHDDNPVGSAKASCRSRYQFA